MKKEYDFSKKNGAKIGKPIDPSKSTMPVSMRLECDLVWWAMDEGEKLGMGYQTFLKMKMHEAKNASKKKTKAG